MIDLIKTCTRCPLHKENPPTGCPVPGKPTYAYKKGGIAIIQLQPTEEETIVEQPYGMYRDYLVKVLRSCKIEQFFHTYLIKCCGLVNNRRVSVCRTWLTQEIWIHRPQYVFTLGKEVFIRLAKNNLPDYNFTLSTLEKEFIGKKFKMWNTTVIPNYHIYQALKNQKYDRKFKYVFNKILG